MIHPAEEYNRARHHAFSTIHKTHNLDDVLKCVNKYELSSTSKSGLLAELKFYERYRETYELIVAADCGDKTDFIGSINNTTARIDVTTNLKYKNKEDYHNLIVYSKMPYYLALVDKDSGALIKLDPLALPTSASLKEQSGADEISRIVDLVVLYGPEYKDGCSKNNPYQEIISLDIETYEIVGRNIITDWYIPDYATLISNIPEEIGDEECDRIIDEHGESTARFLSREYGYKILGCLSYEYRTYGPDGDGEYGFYLRWVHPLLSEIGYKVGDEIEFSMV